VSKQQLDSALRKAAAVWVAPEGHRARLVWALWPGSGPYAGHLLVACGGTDQQVAGLVDGAHVTVVVARAGTRSALLTVQSTAVLVSLDAPSAAAMAAARRNAEPGWAQIYAMHLLGVHGSGCSDR